MCQVMWQPSHLKSKGREVESRIKELQVSNPLGFRNGVLLDDDSVRMTNSLFVPQSSRPVFPDTSLLLMRSLQTRSPTGANNFFSPQAQRYRNELEGSPFSLRTHATPSDRNSMNIEQDFSTASVSFDPVEYRPTIRRIERPQPVFAQLHRVRQNPVLRHRSSSQLSTMLNNVRIPLPGERSHRIKEFQLSDSDV